MKFYIANNNAALEVINPEFSIEAEFGDDVVEGSILTLAHHGPRAGNPPPCVTDVGLKVADIGLGEMTCALSHLDLDALGGIMAVLGRKPVGSVDFWTAAAHVDINGPHRLAECPVVAPDVIRQLQAYWAWSQAHRVFAPQDGTVADITAQVLQAVEAVEAILGGDPALLAAGDAFAAREAELSKASLVQTRVGKRTVLLRGAEQFVNHLYASSAGVADAIVGFNHKSGAITVSVEKTIEGFSCRDFVQGIWGPAAGGHTGIAGSPRDAVLTLSDAENAAAKLEVELSRLA